MKRGSVILIVASVAVAGAAAVGTSWRDDDGAPERRDIAPPTASGAEHAAATLGFYTDSPNDAGIEDLEAHEGRLRRTVGYFTSFGEASSIRGFTSNLNGQLREDRLGQWAAAGELPPFRLVYSLPLAFGPAYRGSDDVADLVEEQWDALLEDSRVRRDHPTAGGLSLDLYREFARRLVALGYGDAIIRLASEHDIQGSPWSSRIDYGKFKEVWRAVVDAMRAEAPQMKFDFTSILASFGAGPDPTDAVLDAYPGDDHVDYIGINVYDQGEPEGSIGVPSDRRCGWHDPNAVFESLQLPALETARAFAVETRKPLSLPEWGLGGGGRGENARTVGRCGGDNPVFIERMFEYFASLPSAGPGSLGFHSYFEGNGAGDGPHALEEFPEAEGTFYELFGDHAG